MLKINKILESMGFKKVESDSKPCIIKLPKGVKANFKNPGAGHHIICEIVYSGEDEDGSGKNCDK